MPDPLVSVIIPVYNCERYIAEAIQSILNQTYHNLEIIAVDDGSSDNSARVIQSFGDRVLYVHQTNEGMASARNHGITMAKGPYFAFLDADDFWVQNKIQMQVAVLEQFPEFDLVSGHTQQFHSPELEETLRQKIHCPAEPLAAHVAGAMLIRRESFFRVGLFETIWDVGTDLNWNLKATEMGLRMKMLPDVVLMRRLHEKNRGITHRHMMGQRLRILKESLDRRRSR